MANKDFPRGMWPLNEGGSARPRMREYAVGNSTTIYRGAPLIRQADGTVTPATTTSPADDIIGVASHYVATTASTTDTVLVFDDPHTLFTIQGDGSGTPAATDVGANAAFAASPNAGNSTTKMSTAELDESSIATTGTLPLRIIGKVERIDNDWGANVDFIVQWNDGTHAYSVNAGI